MISNLLHILVPDIKLKRYVKFFYVSLIGPISIHCKHMTISDCCALVVATNPPNFVRPQMIPELVGHIVHPGSGAMAATTVTKWPVVPTLPLRFVRLEKRKPKL